MFSRLNNRVDSESMAVNCLKLSFDNELSLALFRHWSLYESLLVRQEKLFKHKGLMW